MVSCWCQLRGSRRGQCARPWSGLRQWGSAFIQSPLDLRPFINSTRHHASPGKERVVDRVGRDESISISERDVNHDKVVDVIKLLPDFVCSYLAGNTAYDEVSRGAAIDLI